jgi:zinc transporter 7
MVAFAVGGLLGDTIFHLLPEIFLGEESAEHVRFVMVEPRKNLLLGVAILVGFMTFVAMDKSLRIATGGEGHDHGHGDAHDGVKRTPEASAAVSTSIDTGLTTESKSRKKKKQASQANGTATPSAPPTSQSIKLGAYLNLIADFTHNITDGLAMSASFYTSPTIGATTTVAVFFHEIPHEVGDFALLIQSGFSKRAAMAAQFVTALGALLGTVIGIAVHEFGGSSAHHHGAGGDAPVAGLAGTSLQWGDLLLPFTAGTFLYVGTVAVIPDMLEVAKGANKTVELRKMVTQFAAVAAGAGIMLYISW